MTEADFNSEVAKYPRLVFTRRDSTGTPIGREMAFIVGMEIGPRGGHSALLVNYNRNWAGLPELSAPGRLLFNERRRVSVRELRRNCRI